MICTHTKKEEHWIFKEQKPHLTAEAMLAECALMRMTHFIMLHFGSLVLRVESTVRTFSVQRPPFPGLGHLVPSHHRFFALPTCRVSISCHLPFWRIQHLVPGNLYPALSDLTPCPLSVGCPCLSGLGHPAPTSLHAVLSAPSLSHLSVRHCRTLLMLRSFLPSPLCRILSAPFLRLFETALGLGSFCTASFRVKNNTAIKLHLTTE